MDLVLCVSGVRGELWLLFFLSTNTLFQGTERFYEPSVKEMFKNALCWHALDSCSWKLDSERKGITPP